MADEQDYLEKLLTDVQKTISDNKQFLAKLANEATEEASDEVASDDDSESAAIEEEFEEL